jgi:hypothetical protein
MFINLYAFQEVILNENMLNGRKKGSKWWQGSPWQHLVVSKLTCPLRWIVQTYETLTGSGEEIVGEETDEKGDEEDKGDKGIMGEVEEVEGEAREVEEKQCLGGGAAMLSWGVYSWAHEAPKLWRE